MPRSESQRAWSKRLHERIIALNDSGLTDLQIAGKCSCSTATIERARRAAGLKKKPPYKGFASKMTKEVELWIRKNWLKTNDKKMARKFGVSRGTVQDWRVKIGLRYPHKGQWSRNPHPKGMKGKKHSAAAIELSRRTSIKMWADKNHYLNSNEYKQLVGDRMSKLARTRPKENIYSNAKRGYRDDLGKIFFRSRWEANYARYLNLLKKRGEIHKWEFEAETFWFEKIKRGVRSYCPDFKIWDSEKSEPRFVEIKGWMDPKSQTKLKRMAKYYPKQKIEIVGEKEYRALEKSLGKIIEHWEFKIAVKVEAA